MEVGSSSYFLLLDSCFGLKKSQDIEKNDERIKEIAWNVTSPILNNPLLNKIVNIQYFEARKNALFQEESVAQNDRDKSVGLVSNQSADRRR